MSHEFDLDKLRRNWARAEEPPGLPPAVKTGRVRAPVDVPAEAAQLVLRARTLGLAAHPDRKAALVPFFDRAEGLVAALGGEDADARSAAREELLAVLVDLEDLFEVFGFIQR